MASKSAYSALGVDDEESSSSGSGASASASAKAGMASLSSVRVAFSERAQSAARSAAAGAAGAGFSSAASAALGGDNYGFQSSVLEEGGGAGGAAERLLMPSELKGLGGGLVSSSLDDTRKFRWDKPSRLFRLQRGTRCFRFTLLFLSVLIVFSGYFQFDLPAITVDYILPRLNINMSQYSSIFVGYSVSNTIVPLLSGAFFSRVGKWKGVVIIATTITIGIAIVYVGILTNSYTTVVIGRTVYGLGGESVFVGIDILVTKWFQGAEIGFAYGLIQAAGQAGSFTALYTVPPLVELLQGNIENVYLISLGLSITAVACLGVARCLEKTAYGRKKAAGAAQDEPHHTDKSLAASTAGGFAASVLEDLKSGKQKQAAAAAKASGGGKGEKEDARLLSGPVSVAKGELGPVGGAGAGAGDDDDDEAEEEEDTDVVSEKLNLQLESNLRFFRCCPPLFRLLMFLGIGHMVSLQWRFFCVLGGIICYSSAFYTFLAFGPKWLLTTYHMSEAEAGQTAGIIAIFSMVVSPTIGLVMDQRGGQRFVCFFAMVSACFWFAIMGYTDTAPAICIVFAGISYSLLPASLYPLLPEFVPDESFTTVYAILNSLINLVFTVVLLLAGQILGEGDVSELSATRHSLGRLAAGAWGGGGGGGGAGGGFGGGAGGHGSALPLGLALVGDDPAGANPWPLGDNPADAKDEVDPQKFHYVFAMFVTITAVGTLFTGALAWDARQLMLKGIDLKPRKGAH
jgi:MFS family permease